ncbi:hypothetical protein V8G54_024569 [Vigna mungo]|uniref:Uncharacterized protein n=1 Tax=Vigna mungo TaxID=3915 RepID=A0AAQ3N7N6_VIGMU
MIDPSFHIQTLLAVSDCLRIVSKSRSPICFISTYRGTQSAPKQSAASCTWEITEAVPTQALLGLLIMELTLKSSSSSADFWDCYTCKRSDEITFPHLFLIIGCNTCMTPSMFNG